MDGDVIAGSSIGLLMYSPSLAAGAVEVVVGGQVTRRVGRAARGLRGRLPEHLRTSKLNQILGRKDGSALVSAWSLGLRVTIAQERPNPMHRSIGYVSLQSVERACMKQYLHDDQLI